MLGPVAGSLLYELTGLRLPFLIFASLAGFGLLLLSRRQLPAVPAGGASSAFSLSLLRNPRVVVAALLALAIFLPVGIYDSLWARYMEDRGAGPVFVGVTLAMYGVPFVLLASTGGRLADRFGPVRSAFTCLLVIAPLTYLYGSLESVVLIMVISLVEATAQAVAVPASQAAMAQATPEGNVAAGQGLAGALQQLGAGLMALVAAPVYGASGPAVVFGGAGLLIVLIGGIAWSSTGRPADQPHHPDRHPACGCTGAEVALAPFVGQTAAVG